MLDVLADVLTGATYTDAEVARERDRLVERITVALAQPRTIAREALQRKRFGDHPITREMPRPDAVTAVTAEQVRALHAASTVPRGAILTLVGDIDPDAAIAEVERALSGWSADHAARELGTPPPLVPGDLELVHRPGSVQSQLRLTAPALTRHDDGYAALQLANLVFGGYFSSRWMENVREDKGYTYGAHSGTEFVPGGAVLGVDTDVASDVTAAALLETRYELARMVAVPPTGRRAGVGAGVRDRVAGDLARQPGRAGRHAHRARRRRAGHRVGARPARRAGVGHGRGGRGGRAAVLHPDRVHRGRGRRRRRDRSAGARARRHLLMPFSLTVPPVLSRTVAFRDETLRTDLARQEAGWPTARLVVVDDKGRTPVVWSAEPAAGFQVGDAGSWDVGQGSTASLHTRATTGATPTEGAVLLGEHDGRRVLGDARRARPARRRRPGGLGRPADVRRRARPAGRRPLRHRVRGAELARHRALLLARRLPDPRRVRRLAPPLRGERATRSTRAPTRP